MRVDLYVMVRNEELILPYFFKHYDQFVTKYFVWDDHSTDSTPEILRSNSRVKLLDIPFQGINDDWARHNFFTLYKKYSRGSSEGKSADWVFCVDVDEIMYHPRLAKKLWRYRKLGYELVMPVGYTMVADGLPSGDKQLYEQFKYGFRDRFLSKPVIFSPTIDILFRAGRHSYTRLKHEDDEEPVRKKWKSGIFCLHYRHFGTDYYVERVRRNCERMTVTDDPYFKKKPVWPFDPQRKWRMPDSTRAIPIEWFAEHLSKAQRIIK